jgi:hypothetical protein
MAVLLPVLLGTDPHAHRKAPVANTYKILFDNFTSQVLTYLSPYGYQNAG